MSERASLLFSNLKINPSFFIFSLLIFKPSVTTHAPSPITNFNTIEGKAGIKNGRFKLFANNFENSLLFIIQ